MDLYTHILDTFPTRDAILAGMGFSEMPTVTGFSHMLYFIIYNSVWFGDIHNRYMPNYKNYFLMSTMLHQQNEGVYHPDEHLYSYDRYFRCAMMEYGKLSRYMLHCYSRGLDLDFFDGDYYVLITNVDQDGQASIRAPHVVLKPGSLGLLCPGQAMLAEDTGIDNDIDINVVDDETPDFDSIYIPFNKRKIRSMRRTRMSMLHYKTKIRELTDQLQQSLQEKNNDHLSNTNDRFSILLSNESLMFESLTIEGLTSESELLQEYIHRLEDDMESIKTQLAHYRSIQSIRSELRMNLEFLQKYKLMDDLHMRSVEFCRPDLVYSGNYGCILSETTKSVDFGHITSQIPISTPYFHKRSDDTLLMDQCPRQAWLEDQDGQASIRAPHVVLKPGSLGLQKENLNIMSTLPDELVCIIYSFIGNDTLENVRKKCIMDRYFPDGREDVSKMLKQWRNTDLLHFSKQVFLMYDLNFDRKRSTRITVRKSSNKTDLIENLLRCQYRFTFYEFMRDVFVISKILNDRRRRQCPRQA